MKQVIKKHLYKIPGIFHIALQVETLNVERKTEELKGILWTIKRIYGFTVNEHDLLEELLVVRKETMMDDGWVDYQLRTI